MSKSTRAIEVLCQPQTWHFSGAGRGMSGCIRTRLGRQAATYTKTQIYPCASSHCSVFLGKLHPLMLICSVDTFRTRSTCANPQNHKIQWSSASVQQRRIWILLYLWLKGFTREGIPFLSAYLNDLQLLWLLLRHLKSDCMMQLVKWQGTKIDVPVKQAVRPGQKTKDCK